MKCKVAYESIFYGADGLKRVFRIGKEGQKDDKKVSLTLTGLSISEDDREGIFEVGRRSFTGVFTCLVKSPDMLDKFPASSAHDMPFELVRVKEETEEIEWRGYVRPGSYEMSWPGVLETVKLSLCGCLDSSKSFYLKSSDSFDFETLGSLLNESLLLCGFDSDTPIFWPQDSYCIGATRSGASVLGLSVNRYRFINKELAETDSLQPRKPMLDAGTVIDALMNIFGYTMREVGGALWVTRPGCERYVRLSLDEVLGISPTSTFEGFNIVDLSEKNFVVEDFLTTEDTVSFLPGRKGVEVIVDLAKSENIDVAQFDIDDFPLVGFNTFFPPYGKNREDTIACDRYMRTEEVRKFFSDENDSGTIETFCYHGRDRVRVSDLAKSGAFILSHPDLPRNPFYSDFEGNYDARWARYCGAVPVKIAHYQYERKDHGGNFISLGWNNSSEWKSGVLVNMWSDEGGPRDDRSAFLSSHVPIMCFRGQNKFISDGGGFLLNFNLYAFHNKEREITPLFAGVRVYAVLRVGEKYFHSEENFGIFTSSWRKDFPSESSETHDYPGACVFNLNRRENIKADIPSEKDSPAGELFCWHRGNSCGEESSFDTDNSFIYEEINMRYLSNRGGFYFDCPAGLSGDVELYLYLDGEPENLRRGLDLWHVLFTDLSFKYEYANKIELDFGRSAKKAEKGTKTLLRRLEGDDDACTLNLLLGTCENRADRGYSTLFWGQNYAGEVTDIMRDSETDILERWQLSSLSEYYGTTRRRYRVTVRGGADIFRAGRLSLPNVHTALIQTAVSVDYFSGSMQYILDEIVGAN